MSPRLPYVMMAADVMARMYADNAPLSLYEEKEPTTISVRFSSKSAPLFGEPHRELKEFSIKGRKAMAYSKKDAITRLKHMKKEMRKAKVKDTDCIINVMPKDTGGFIGSDGVTYKESQIDFLPEESPESVTIEGYVAVDEYGMGGTFLHTSKPTAVDREFCDTGEYEVYWESDGEKYELDSKLFPDMTPDLESKKYRITITPIEDE